MKTEKIVITKTTESTFITKPRWQIKQSLPVYFKRHIKVLAESPQPPLTVSSLYVKRNTAA